MKNRKYIAARSGKALQHEDSDKVQKGISRWQAHQAKKALDECSQMSYWQTISTCSRL